MTGFRKYGQAPFQAVLLHGGPGAAGEMAPVARQLAFRFGALEPLQSKKTISGQVQELHRVVLAEAVAPIKLVGYSWGAWLAVIFAARYPDLISKLILISSGPFEQQYVDDIMDKRFSRLDSQQRTNLKTLLHAIQNSDSASKSMLLEEVGRLISIADSFCALPGKTEVQVDFEIHDAIWKEASQLRKTGELMSIVQMIGSPVIAIHGDYDPHPCDGVKMPLSQTLRDFRFILLEKCGHTPWKEKFASEQFYKVLSDELA